MYNGPSPYRALNPLPKPNPYPSSSPTVLLTLTLSNSFSYVDRDPDSEVDTKGNDGRTALMWASLNGHTGAIKTLIANGAQVHTATLYSNLYPHCNLNGPRCMRRHLTPTIILVVTFITTPNKFLS